MIILFREITIRFYVKNTIIHVYESQRDVGTLKICLHDYSTKDVLLF